MERSEFRCDSKSSSNFVSTNMPSQQTNHAVDSPWKAIEYRQTLIAKWTAFALLGWMFLPVFTGRIYVCDDLQNYHLPVRQFYAECLARNEPFDWMPNLFCGFFLTGSGQGGTYHPLHYLLYRFLPLTTAFNLELFVSYPFMLFGMQLFLRRHLQRSDAAWLGAIVFTFSGFCTLHFLHPNAIAVVAHIPWLLLAHDVLLRPSASSRRWRIPVELSVALLTGSQLLLGYPQYVWFSLLAEITLCLALAGFTWNGFRKLTLIALLKCFGFMLGAVQLLPSMAALADSDRTSMPPEFFFQYPLSLADMLQWIGPFLTRSRVFGANTHELGVYCGAIPVILALSLIRKHESNAGRQLLLPMLTLGLIALWLSLGREGGLYHVQSWLPLIGKFRYPSRIVVLMHLVLAVLAATGYTRLMQDIERRKIRLPDLIQIVPFLSAAAAIGVAWLGAPENAAPWTLIILGPVLFFLAVQVTKDLLRGRFSPVFMLFLVGDLAAYGLTYEALRNTKTFAEVLESLDQPPGSPDDGRIVAELQLANEAVGYEGNDLLLAGWRQADGYEGLLPRMHLFEQNTSLESLRIAGVRWINSGGNHGQIEGLIKTQNPRWLEVPFPVPRARLAVRTITTADPQQAVRILQPDGPTIVEHDSGIPTDNPSVPGTAGILVDRPGLISVQTTNESTQLLVLAERYSGDWTATVNGIATPVVRAEADFMGCIIPAGIHTVQFRFDSASVRNGRLVSLGTLIMLLLYAFGRIAIARRHVSVRP